MIHVKAPTVRFTDCEREKANNKLIIFLTFCVFSHALSLSTVFPLFSFSFKASDAFQSPAGMGRTAVSHTAVFPAVIHMCAEDRSHFLSSLVPRFIPFLVIIYQVCPLA